MLRFRGFGALIRHEYAAATELLEQALAGFEALDDRRGVAWARQNLAWCAFYSGRAEEAEVLLRKAAATFEEIGDQGGLRWAHGLLAWTRFQQGHSAEAGEMAEAILTDDRRGGDRWALGMMLDPGRLRAALDRPHPQRHRPAARGPRRSSRRSTTTSATRRPSAVLGRALVLAGQVDEGLDDGRVDGPAPTARRSASASTSCR